MAIDGLKEPKHEEQMSFEGKNLGWYQSDSDCYRPLLITTDLK